MTISYDDYLALLQPVSDNKLEEMDKQARQLTLKQFGKTILLYAPIYLSNECDNNCVYCGFNQRLEEKRVTLSVADAVGEAEILYQKGFRHLLLVSGEKRDRVSLAYLKEIITKLHNRFDSISLEIFPLEEPEYRELYLAGADGLTIYQEVYNREIYQQVHVNGPKADYDFRMQTPERAARAGFYPPHPISDRQMTQLICALRVFLPSIGLVLSTREKAGLRDSLLPLGITQMSAESKTSPGAYAGKVKAEEQFEISDKHSLAEIGEAIAGRGYDPVLKDWDRGFQN